MEFLKKFLVNKIPHFEDFFLHKFELSIIFRVIILFFLIKLIFYQFGKMFTYSIQADLRKTGQNLLL